MNEKEEIINALRVLVKHCDKFQDDDIYWNRCQNPENPCECIFWDTCYYDAYHFCSTLRDVLKDIEKGRLL